MDSVVLDPEVEAALGSFSFGGGLTREALTMMRSARVDMGSGVELSDKVERADYEVVEGHPEVVIRVHRPVGISEPLPCVYSIHGGGYIVGSYTMDDPRFDDLSPRMPCVGVSVEYRLAPETPYPGPLDDCYAGLQWVWEHAKEIGVDRDRIGVSGTSAGGGLAAALALLVRDRGEMSLAFQLLECPMLDDRQATSSSRRDGLPVWTKEANTFGWECYLGDLYGTDDVPAYAAAARALDLANLPPALVIVGGADGFRDEDIEYALRLGQCGVQAELHVLPGAPHGVQLAAGSAIAKRWRTLVDDWLDRQLNG